MALCIFFMYVNVFIFENYQALESATGLMPLLGFSFLFIFFFYFLLLFSYLFFYTEHFSVLLINSKDSSAYTFLL